MLISPPAAFNPTQSMVPHGSPTTHGRSSTVAVHFPSAAGPFGSLTIPLHVPAGTGGTVGEGVGTGVTAGADVAVGATVGAMLGARVPTGLTAASHPALDATTRMAPASRNAPLRFRTACASVDVGHGRRQPADPTRGERP